MGASCHIPLYNRMGRCQLAMTMSQETCLYSSTPEKPTRIGRCVAVFNYYDFNSINSYPYTSPCLLEMFFYGLFLIKELFVNFVAILILQNCFHMENRAVFLFWEEKMPRSRKESVLEPITNSNNLSENSLHKKAIGYTHLYEAYLHKTGGLLYEKIIFIVIFNATFSWNSSWLWGRRNSAS